MGIKKDMIKGRESFNFTELLKPYEEGGTEAEPVRRTLETITTHLVISNRFPPKVTGAAIFRVFYEMQFSGLKFKGDETYGSKGRELFNHIKRECIDIVKLDTSQEVATEIMELTSCGEMDCKKRKKQIKKRSKLYKIMVWFQDNPKGFLVSVGLFSSSGYGAGHFNETIIDFIKALMGIL